MIGLLMAWAVVGTEGIPIPYSPRMDDGITVVLLCCFFLSAYVLSRSRKFLLQLVTGEEVLTVKFEDKTEKIPVAALYDGTGLNFSPK